MAGIVQLGGIAVGDGCPTLVIAEAGVNHEGNIDLARRLVDAAAEAGANAIKFQTYSARQLVSLPAMRHAASVVARKHYPWLDDPSWLSRMDKTLTAAEYQQLWEYARSRGLLLLSSAWEEEAVDLLEQIGAAAHKVGSGDLTHLPLLRYIARKRKPILLSVGIGSLAEIRHALEAIRGEYAQCAVVLLHCIVSYPACAEHLNLRFIQTLKRRFRLPVGFSDHSLDTDAGALAVAAGAAVVEKHLTLDRTLPGLDHPNSLLPNEFREMVRKIRRAESMLGTGAWQLTAVECEERILARRGCTAARDLVRGEKITRDKVRFQRPALGLSPGNVQQLLGRRLRRSLTAGDPIRLRDTV